jgi:hypothetical protein
MPQGEGLKEDSKVMKLGSFFPSSSHGIGMLLNSAAIFSDVNLKNANKFQIC